MNIEVWTAFLVSFISGTLSALGMGGGGILLIYLTAYAGMAQLNAQGINLLFFIPIAVTALFFHTKNKLVQWRTARTGIFWGSLGVLLGAGLAHYLGSGILQKLFALFILYMGVKELFSKK